jgi:hypothetical protein
MRGIEFYRIETEGLYRIKDLLDQSLSDEDFRDPSRRFVEISEDYLNKMDYSASQTLKYYR